MCKFAWIRFKLVSQLPPAGVITGLGDSQTDIPRFCGNMPLKSDIWQHVAEHSVKDKYGNVDCECLYCGHTWKGGATRILAHLCGDMPALGAASCNNDSIEDLRAQLIKDRVEKEKQGSRKRKLH